ncbi:hypothetical protein SAMN04487965_0077 [Microbulbifer donghaiensis]|uniref:YXWGXW repeat-containing protein n=1 Tax=Microbulbifer donghaiensis TaxID=494016 RepID=A0A1M4U750_9GAMM|nr:hypothetical protein [Microbulbifer donghaiensis]SHE52474.1 hypothetical protein SAMN04487965_0077 [Microbulbifer donghaiensis]
MRQVPYRLLAALAITLTLGGCVTYPAAPPVVVGSTYVRKAAPVYSYSVITDPGYRYYDDTLGVYVFYDRSDVFYRQGHYYRWHQDHWISANHWRGPWYPAPNLYISANFNDRWHTRLRRHGHRYAGGRDYRPPRRNVHDDGYNRRDRHESNGYRRDRREEGQDRREKGQNRGRGGEHGFAGIAEPKRRASQTDNRSGHRDDRREKGQNRDRGGEHGFAGLAEPKRRASQTDNRSGERGNERRKPRRNPSRDERVVKVADKPTGIRAPRVVPALERPATDRRAVRDRPKPQNQRGQPQRQYNAPNDRRNTAAKPAARQEGEEPKEKKKKSKKKADKSDQARRAREPLARRSNEANLI